MYTLLVLRDPGDRQQAPARFRPVQAFVNTLDIENGVDELLTTDQLRAVLADQGLLDTGARIAPADVSRARALRETLRSLLLANNGGTVGPDALAALEGAGRRAKLEVCFRIGARPELLPRAEGVDGALGRLVAIVYDALVDGSWRRLKACRRDVCFWAFYDRSKNLSGTWCAMSVCGNRTKVRRYRGSRRAEPR